MDTNQSTPIAAHPAQSAQLTAYKQRAMNRAANNRNTPITRAELDEVREAMPGQRFGIVTGEFDNRRQRRAYGKGRLYNNRAMTIGRIAERLTDPVYGKRLFPARQNSTMQKRGLKRVFGSVTKAVKYLNKFFTKQK